MREKIFRGKAEDGKWVFGHYVIVGNNHFITTGKVNIVSHGYLGMGQDDETEELDYILVDEKTVGQYIGKQDKDKNKIFEGDYLGDYCEDDNGNEILGHYGVVTYWESECRWVLADEDGIANDWTDEYMARPESWDWLYTLGTIHDEEAVK